jgi:hypothetical protein
MSLEKAVFSSTKSVRRQRPTYVGWRETHGDGTRVELPKDPQLHQAGSTSTHIKFYRARDAIERHLCPEPWFTSIYCEMELQNILRLLSVDENFAYQSLYHTSRDFQHAEKSYDMGPTALLSLQMKTCYGFVSTLKIHRSRLGLNPRTVGPIANTITLHHRERLLVIEKRRKINYK